MTTSPATEALQEIRAIAEINYGINRTVDKILTAICAKAIAALASQPPAPVAELLRISNISTATALQYVVEMTHIGADGEWHFKIGYDPQIALDALVLHRRARSLASNQKE